VAWTQRYLTLPETLDIASRAPPELSKHWEEAAYIVHCVYGRFMHDSRRYDPDDWVYLKIDKLREVVSWKRLSKWIDWLRENGVIEVDLSYRAGFYSRSYRMTGTFRYAYGVIRPVKNRRLNRKIDKFRNDQQDRFSSPTIKSLYQLLRGLEIDTPAALRHVRFAKDYSATKNPKFAQWMDESSITMISTHQFFLMEDKYGRVHSNLTNLSSDLRQYLRWHGESLWNTDVRNSQPFIFGCLLMFLFNLSDTVESDKVRELIHKIERYSLQNDYSVAKVTTERLTRNVTNAQDNATQPQESPSPSHTLMMQQSNEKSTKETTYGDFDCKNTQELYQEPTSAVPLSKSIESDVLSAIRLVKHHWKECERYITLCCEGQLYDHFQKLVPAGTSYASMARHEFKQTFFRECIFCEKEDVPGRLFRDLFVREFPHVWKIICTLKRSHHSVLPKLLQNIESQYVIHKAAAAFLKARPKRFLGTIHDSLLVTESDAKFAEQCLVDCFRQSRLSPTVAVVPA
jgi:hypothetical protein